jgi:hypothetical protein
MSALLSSAGSWRKCPALAARAWFFQNDEYTPREQENGKIRVSNTLSPISFNTINCTVQLLWGKSLR